MKRVLGFVLAYLLFSAASYAQWNLSVIVKNGSGESLEGANVQLNEPARKSVTNAKGLATFENLPSGSYTFNVSYIGYKSFSEQLSLNSDRRIDVILQQSNFVTEEIVINGVRAANNQPASFTVLNKEDIENQNFGQDVPYLLSLEPSVVTTSDAGTGIGYTSMRIRGLDSRKVNVTINGIPYNDPESHGTFWVDIPDIASSVKSIQLQRGLGKSAVGPAAFGASLNLETSKIPRDHYITLDNSIGSYNTMKNTIEAGTGLLNGHWFAEGRFSRIGTDGYIDRATSNLRSYFAQAGYYSEKSIFRIITFGGFEETYQAWYGIDSSSINYYNRKFNWAGYYTRNGQENFYDKQVDHYAQNHFQANYIHSFSNDVQFNAILNYTKGKGYYQDYNDSVAYADYLISGSDTTADLTDRKWLDNQLLAGNTFLTINAGKINVTTGVGFSRYFKARHYGEILWVETLGNSLNGFRYYQNEGNKTDVSPYVKLNYAFGQSGNLYLDVNYRFVDYKANGIDRESGYEVPLDIHKTYNFLNPIVGISYSIPSAGVLYAVVGASHREPARSDFINNYPEIPRPERMYNTEIGIRRQDQKDFFYELNLYYMLYRDELIKTGQLDDVGAPIVKNAGKSYRTGIELNAGYNPLQFLAFRGNVALSRNKTDFKDYINNSWLILNNADISFSPSVVAAGEIAVKPVRNVELAFISKYVGKQYLDNTQNENRILNDYLVSNARLNAKLNYGLLKNLEFKFQVNNLFNVKYNSNGYMYGDTPYYYPQALRNFLLGLTLGF